MSRQAATEPPGIICSASRVRRRSDPSSRSRRHKRDLRRDDVGVLDGGEAALVQQRDRAAHVREGRRLGRLGDDPSDQVHRTFLEGARRLARGGVALDDAVRRIQRLAVDAGGAQGRGVRPGRVAVVALQESRAIGDDLVELRGRRQPARERHVLPAATQHPRGVAMLRGVHGDRDLDLPDGRELEQVDLVERLGARHDVDVGVVEPRRDEPAAGVHDRRGRVAVIAQAVIVTAQPGDVAVAHGDGGRRRDRPRADVRSVRSEVARGVGDEDPPVDDQQVGHVAHRSRKPVPSGSRSSSTKACSPVR